MSKHYLITGGAGFIGSHLSELLLAQGNRVTIIDDLSTGNAANLAGVRDQIEIIQSKVSACKDLAKIAQNCPRVIKFVGCGYQNS